MTRRVPDRCDVAPGPTRQLLTVVIPAFNEEARIGASLARIRAFMEGAGRFYELLVVDDCSGDGTRSLVDQARSGWPELKLLQLPTHQGKGSAVRAGMLAGRGVLRLFTDADLSTPIEEMSKLEAAVSAGAGIAIGSRACPESSVRLHQPRHRELMGRAYNWAVQTLVLPGLQDTQCGFKLFSASAAAACFAELECQRFGFDVEVLLRAQLAGIQVAEVGVAWCNAPGTQVRATRDSIQMLQDLWRLRRRHRCSTTVASRQCR